ncbi:PIR protein [Plasmodium yoelii]|uniref:PIR protein n=2 Tax=Plasmodium yoelii TaxID=5861 RepID=A0AAE9WQ96_PLAYO|nr:PIR protein [Plasmodium yoelii]WBY58282.1 PIR protein [Plasmodium yoelii yoelii]CDS44343.1 YIR protein [Plasmodium yoelii]VTZ79200.1 PIR protein [Plasmodium yoelii]|eukprot:XP_034493515.1 PIR protein [Plasmodium yoelii]
MDKQVCGILISISNSISKKLDKNKNYQIVINESTLNRYCSGNSCDNDLDKINAGCLYLLDSFFKDSSVFRSYAKSNTNIVEYIIIWLSYMLNLKEQFGKTNLQYFYEIYIQGGDQYKNSITGVTGYNSYKDLIDNKIDLINMDMSIVPKLYDAFYTLCMMYLEFDEESRNCSKNSGRAKEFVEKYEYLKKNYSITKNSPYYKLLSTLSKDYDNFKKKCSDVSCKDIPPLQSIEKTEINVNLSEHSKLTSVQTSEDASSSSSITNNLFIVLSIFGAIAFFLGISYKYSLFGFRKRFQKQKLREKLKNIKKRINH